MKQREDIFSGGSYASSSDPRPHFGLGPATTIDKVEIRWPDGVREERYSARHRSDRHRC